jgi:hypothetical protein
MQTSAFQLHDKLLILSSNRLPPAQLITRSGLARAVDGPPSEERLADETTLRRLQQSLAQYKRSPK